MKKKSITTEEFDKRFDEGEDMSMYIDWSKSVRLKDLRDFSNLQSKRVSVDFPSWMVDQLDEVSRKLGVTRQSVIKFFIADRLKQEKEGA